MLRYIRLLVYHIIEQTNEEKYKCALAMVHYWKQEIYIGALKLTTLSRSQHKMGNIFVVFFCFVVLQQHYKITNIFVVFFRFVSTASGALGVVPFSDILYTM